MLFVTYIKYINVYMIIIFICYFTCAIKRKKGKRKMLNKERIKRPISAHTFQQILAVDCRSDGSDCAHGMKIPL
jgi:hypothetical protein